MFVARTLIAVSGTLAQQAAIPAPAVFKVPAPSLIAGLTSDTLIAGIAIKRSVPESYTPVPHLDRDFDPPVARLKTLGATVLRVRHVSRLNIPAIHFPED